VDEMLSTNRMIHFKLERSMAKEDKFFLSLSYLSLQHISVFLSLLKLTQKTALQPIIYCYHCYERILKANETGTLV
jgi:hypothetical protein